MLLNPSAATRNLCIGTALFHASLIALRGPTEQIRRLTAVERMPYTMTTAVSLLAAGWASVDGKRVGSYVFSGLHFAAFLLDVCSHIPGGKHVFRLVRTPRPHHMPLNQSQP